MLQSPLTSLAQSMVLASMREPHSGVYILQDVCACKDMLDMTHLRKAWNQVASHHDVLRTSIVVNAAGQAVSHIEAAPDYTCRELDWRQSSGEETERGLLALLENDRREGFDFKFGIPLRLTLIRTGEDGHILVLTAHHALLDGRSLVAVWKEWLGVYEALAKRRAPALPAIPPLAECSAEAAQRFWQTYLAGLESTTGFITDRLKPAAPPVSRRYAEYRCSLELEATAQLRGFARANGVGLGTLVNAAWAILLSRYSGRKDVVFGVRLSGRSPSQKDVVGLLINTLPVRIQIEPGAPLAPWLGQIRRHSLAMREHQTTRVEDAIEWGGLPAGTPPFDSVVVYDHEPPQESLRRLGGNWRQRTLRRYQGTDLPLVLASYGEPVLLLNIGYDTNLYCEDTVVAMASHLRTILASMCSHPDGRLSDIGMLTDSEKEMFLRPRALQIDSSLCAHNLFEAQVRRTPAHAALETGDEIITYDDLNRRANRLASMLRKQGVGPEDLVAVSLSSVRDTIVAILGILKAGGAFISVDPAAPAERRARMLADARPKFTFDEDTALAALPEQPDNELSPSAGATNAAYAVFTSGSTGKPKGIVISHRALVNQTLAVVPVFGITPSDRRLQFASLGSDVFVAEIFNYLTAGATIVICPDARRSSLQEFHRLIDDKRITITAVPGSWWNIWASALSAGSVRLPRSLRAIVVGMERADPAAFHAWRQAAGNRLRWFNAYGPAENSGISTIYEAGTSRWECAEALPIGQPIANTTAYVLDDEGDLLPAGVAGELYVGGPGVARGYLGVPELTAARFLDDPFRAGSRLYRTGDRAYALPDGNLVFAGRVDRQVKVRGYRVELDEIEEALARHPAVRQCAVVVTGDGDLNRLGAYVVGSASKHDLRLHLIRLLPEYMIPSVWMSLDLLPLTPTGKIDRRALPPCEQSAQALSIDFPPSTQGERRLAMLWREVLGVPEVNLLDDFFQLGGDSLRATKLLLRVQDEFSIQLSLADLFQTPTLARLAARLDAGRETNGSLIAFHEAVIPIQPQGEGLPLFLIHPEFEAARLARHLGPDRPLFGVPVPTAADPAAVRTIDEMAAECTRALRRFRPQGPYALAGWCAGGVIALEVARQIEQVGGEIAFVAMLDVRNLFPPPLSVPHLAWVRLWRRAWRLSYVARRWPAGLWNRVRSSLTSAPLPRLPETTQALLRHRPLPWSGRMVHIWASDWPHGRYFDPGFAWNHLAPAGFVFHEVPGDHLTLLQEPSIAEVASLLAGELDRAQRTQQPTSARRAGSSSPPRSNRLPARR